MATKFFVRRSSTTAWRDEDVAMSSQTFGPYDTQDEAQRELIKATRNELADLLSFSPNSAAVRRMREINDRAIDGESDITHDGLRWRITSH